MMRSSMKLEVSHLSTLLLAMLSTHHLQSMSHKDLFFGRGGEMVVMSEFLLRGYNVAVPEIDVGDDIYVVEDQNGNLRRVQVKSANCNSTKKGYTGQVNVKY